MLCLSSKIWRLEDELKRGNFVIISVGEITRLKTKSEHGGRRDNSAETLTTARDDFSSFLEIRNGPTTRITRS